MLYVLQDFLCVDDRGRFFILDFIYVFATLEKVKVSEMFEYGKK